MARAQFDMFLELGTVFDVIDREDDVVDPRAAGSETGVDVFADLLDLSSHIALADAALTSGYRLLAEVHMNRGRFDLALSQTERALEINPNDAESFATRGAILAWAGRATEALPWAEGPLRLDPANARAAFYLGMAYYLLARYDDSVGAMDRALAGNLGRNTTLHLGGRLRTVG